MEEGAENTSPPPLPGCRKHLPLPPSPPEEDSINTVERAQYVTFHSQQNAFSSPLLRSAKEIVTAFRHFPHKYCLLMSY